MGFCIILHLKSWGNLPMRKNVIIFGAGVEGRQALTLIGKERVRYFVDNCMDLWGKDIEDIEIISCEKLKSLSGVYDIVIATRRYYREIAEQLNTMHITKFERVYQFLIREKFAAGKDETKRIILMNTHDKTNVGDHLISVAEKCFFEEYLKGFKVIEIPAEYIDNNLADLKSFINKTDIVAITGGGFLGSLWLEAGEINVRKIIHDFADNKIIVMPQTMYFEDTKNGIVQQKITKEIYSKHPNLTLCFREKTSYDLGNKLFDGKVKLLYCPDMVTLLNFKKYFRVRGNKIGLCLRKDKESILTLEDQETISKSIKSKGNEVIEFSMHTEKAVVEKQRAQAIREKLEIIGNTKLVITDRLHCMLLCAISGVPCVAFDNLSGKVSGVYEWIKNNSYIKFARNIESGIMYIDELWSQKECVYNNELVKKCFVDLASEFRV